MHIPDTDIKDLALATVIADTGRLSAAADHLDLSVSAVSHRLTALEARLGARLFERSGRGMDITAAGALFVRHARLALEAALAAEQVTERPREVWRIGSAWLMATTVLPPLMGRLAGTYPRQLVEVRTGRSETVLDWVENRTVDVGLVRASGQRPGVALRPVGTDPVVLAAAGRHPWHETAPSLADLAATPLITVHERTGYGHFLAAWARDAGFRPASWITVDHLEGALALAAADVAPALLPQSLVITRAAGGAVLAVRDPPLALPSRILALAWPSARALPHWAEEWAGRIGRWLAQTGMADRPL